MSLFDVDKNAHDRSSPSVNKKDQIPHESVMAKQTLSTTHITPDSSTTGQRIQMLNNQIIATDNNNNAVALFGQDSTGNTVLKVAQSGYDARTATNSQLVFNSNQDILKVVLSGTITVSITAGGGAVATVVAHGLSNIPMAIVYWSGSPSFWGSGNTWYPTPYGWYYSSTNYFDTQYWVDSTYIHFQVEAGSATGAATGTYTFKYRLLQESAN